MIFWKERAEFLTKENQQLQRALDLSKTIRNNIR